VIVNIKQHLCILLLFVPEVMSHLLTKVMFTDRLVIAEQLLFLSCLGFVILFSVENACVSVALVHSVIF